MPARKLSPLLCRHLNILGGTLFFIFGAVSDHFEAFILVAGQPGGSVHHVYETGFSSEQVH